MYVVSFKAKCNVALYKKAYNVRYRRLWMLFVLLHVFRVKFAREKIGKFLSRPSRPSSEKMVPLIPSSRLLLQ